MDHLFHFSLQTAPCTSSLPALRRLRDICGLRHPKRTATGHAATRGFSGFCSVFSEVKVFFRLRLEREREFSITLCRYLATTTRYGTNPFTACGLDSGALVKGGKWLRSLAAETAFLSGRYGLPRRSLGSGDAGVPRILRSRTFDKS